MVRPGKDPKLRRGLDSEVVKFERNKTNRRFLWPTNVSSASLRDTDKQVKALLSAASQGKRPAREPTARHLTTVSPRSRPRARGVDAYHRLGCLYGRLTASMGNGVEALPKAACQDK